MSIYHSFFDLFISVDYPLIPISPTCEWLPGTTASQAVGGVEPRLTQLLTSMPQVLVSACEENY